MNYSSKCPICNKELIRYGVSHIAGQLAEENYRCPRGHYSYEFHYGTYYWRIGDTTLLFNYKEPKNRYSEVQREVKRLIKLEKKNIKMSMQTADMNYQKRRNNKNTKH